MELEGKEQQMQRLKVQLDEGEALIARLKDKLDLKDEVMEKLTGENRQLITEILSLKDRVHEMELRLARDESLLDRSLSPGGMTYGQGPRSAVLG